MKESFKNIRTELKKFDDSREKTIATSRDIIKLSKVIIYSIHRNDMKNAENLIKDIKNKLKLLDEKHYDTNINKVAWQEYVEAITYYEFIKTGKVPGYKKLGVNIDHYLLGLCDLTGELVRKAVNDVINKNYKGVLKIKDLVSDIYGEFLSLDLRNGELRVKSDAIKYNLKKLEDLVLELKLKKLL